MKDEGHRAAGRSSSKKSNGYEGALENNHDLRLLSLSVLAPELSLNAFSLTAGVHPLSSTETSRAVLSESEKCNFQAVDGVAPAGPRVDSACEDAGMRPGNDNGVEEEKRKESKAVTLRAEAVPTHPLVDV